MKGALWDLANLLLMAARVTSCAIARVFDRTRKWDMLLLYRINTTAMPRDEHERSILSDNDENDDNSQPGLVHTTAPQSVCRP